MPTSYCFFKSLIVASSAGYIVYFGMKSEDPAATGIRLKSWTGPDSFNICIKNRLRPIGSSNPLPRPIVWWTRAMGGRLLQDVGMWCHCWVLQNAGRTMDRYADRWALQASVMEHRLMGTLAECYILWEGRWVSREKRKVGMGAPYRSELQPPSTLLRGRYQGRLQTAITRVGNTVTIMPNAQFVIM